MPYKIAITGRFRTGKNTVANMLTDLLEGETTQLAFADALKVEAANLLVKNEPASDKHSTTQIYQDVLNPANKYLYGTLFQFWGEYRRQTAGLNYWIEHPRLKYRYLYAVRREHNIIITDMRHLNEAVWCKSNGFFLVRVRGLSRSEDARSSAHASERDVESIIIDRVVDNTGSLEELHRQVVLLVRKLVSCQ